MTVSEIACVLAEGAPEVAAEIVMGDVPTGVAVEVPIISVTETGAAAVGFTLALGEKLQFAPLGRPLQASDTAPWKDPDPVTWNVIACDVDGRFTVTVLGEGVEMPKSTT